MMKPLSYWLAQIIGDDPIHQFWRSQIERLWDFGSISFKKVPVFRDGDMCSILPKGLPAGPARPLACPEPAPANSEFSILHYDGVDWQQSTMPTLLDLDSDECQAKIHRMMVLEKASASVPEIDDLMKGLSIMLPDNVEMDEVARVFAAGVSFGRSQMIPSVGEDGTHHGRDWMDIIFHAFERHGERTAPLVMVEKLGGRIIDKMVRDPGDGSTLLRRESISWKDGSETDPEEFQKRYREWRKKRPLKARRSQA